MTAPKVDFVVLADNVQVPAATTQTSTDRITMTPGRSKLQIAAVALTAAGAGVAGCSLTIEMFLQGPSPSGVPLTRQGWYTITTLALPATGTGLGFTVFDILSLGAGLDVNYGTTVRVQMVTTGAEGYFTIVAIAGD